MTALLLVALSTGAKLVGLAFLVAVSCVALSILRDILTALRDCACGPGIHHPACRLRTVKH